MAFIANLATIKTELAEGWTAKSIYDRLADKLAGRVSYPQFVRYVRQLREDGTPSPLRGGASSGSPVTRLSPALPPVPADVTVPIPSAAGPSANARHEPTGPRRFDYDGTPRQDDSDRLIGGPRTRAKE